jgi:phosphatidylserine/phosphatidylglycerophosphate/cardiolipin synthase-like enzyme
LEERRKPSPLWSGRSYRIITLVVVLIAICCNATKLAAAEDGSTGAWQVCFSPNAGCTQDIVNAINAARRQIVVQAYEMTSPQIKSALVAAHRRGVQIKAIFDPDALKEPGSKVGELAAAGIPVFVDSFHKPGIAHNKVMVIDDAMVITGSFNFTKAAESRNAENLLVIHDTALAAEYERNFEAHLAHSSALGAAEIPPPRSTYHRRRYYRHYWNSYW